MSEADVARPPRARGAADLLAYALTYAVSPLSLPLGVAAAGVLALGGSGGEARTAAAAAFVGNGLVPLAALLVLFGRGHVASLEVRERRRRTLPYLAGTLGTLVSAAGLWLFLPGAYGLLVTATLWQAFNTLLLLAVNRRTKVSVHVYALASSAVFLGYLRLHGGEVAPLVLALLSTLVPVLAWARLRIRAHTGPQVALGAALGATLLPLELWLTALAAR